MCVLKIKLNENLKRRYTKVNISKSFLFIDINDYCLFYHQFLTDF